MILPGTGSDMINCLKQVVQFGLNQADHVAGTQQELESLAAAAAGSTNRRLDVRMVLETAGRSRCRKIRRRYSQGQQRPCTDRAPLVRLCVGHELCLWSRTRRRRSRRSKLAGALENFELPDDVKLQPNKVYYRKGDHQLIDVGLRRRGPSKGKDDPEDLYRVDEVVPGDKTAPAVTGDRLHRSVAGLA